MHSIHWQTHVHIPIDGTASNLHKEC